ncbi:MAG: UDP-N-acetylmuramate dehydrogenase [Prevotella sp.]|nr:UDP-N-acetylmuramate dehydrogenase [Candidatus Prevotella equi]
MKSLLKHNTFGIDQSCRELYEPTTVEELLAIRPKLLNEPLLVIGAGSNLLLTSDFNGNVLHPMIKGIELVDDAEPMPGKVLLRCGAGETWDDVVDYAISNCYYDMENLSLIPGEVGASAVQNIGAYGMEAKDLIYKVEAVEISTGKKFTFNNADCCYAYRYSIFKSDWKDRFVITHVTYRISTTFTPRLDYGNLRKTLLDRNITEPTARDVRQAVIDIRNEKLPDPAVEGNAGSFFMNPVVSKAKYQELLSLYPSMPHYYIDEEHEKIPAGWMIEQCGWKGKTLGKAGVHSRQALVLVNKGGAKGADVVALCEAIRSDVQEKFGIDIHPEVNIV